MLTKKLITACKHAALAGGLAFVVAATTSTVLANNSGNTLRIVSGETVASNSLPNVNPTCDNEGDTIGNYIGNG
jgi:hypothetical protein